MTNRIIQIQFRNHRLSPVEAEVWVTVVPDHVTPGTELRGRLTGPRCPYTTTVEVAYPLRPLSPPMEGLPILTMRVIIPEPSWWDPVSPFLYGGPIELWQHGQRCDVVQVQHGLRSFRIADQRLRFNGHPLMLDGTERALCSEEEALRLRKAGLNTLLVPVRKDTRGVWDLADRLGFLVLGRIPIHRVPRASAAVLFADYHPSCLGWLLEGDAWETVQLAEAVAALIQTRPRPLVGVELQEPPGSLPDGLHFVLCHEERLPDVSEIALPKLVRTESRDANAKEWPSLPGVMGTITAPN